MSTLAPPATTSRPAAPGVLAAISTSHVVNDMMQSLILAIYPVIKGGFNLSFTQIGLITLT
ncbi:MAG TPA: MFS transporter, partial [Stenotrophomonas sp.]|nr:MFS transporter [Stenotrophomonas sp.]